MNKELNIPSYLSDTAYASLVRKSLNSSIDPSRPTALANTSPPPKVDPVDNSDSEGEPDLNTSGSMSHNEEDEEEEELEDDDEEEDSFPDDEDDLDDDEDARIDMDVDHEGQTGSIATPNFFSSTADFIRIPRLSGAALLNGFNDSKYDVLSNAKSLPWAGPGVANVPPLPSQLQLKDDSMAERVGGWIDLMRTDRAMFVQADNAIPPECGVYYFEISVKSPSGRPIHAALGLASKGSHSMGSFPRSVLSRNSQDGTDTFRAVSDLSIQSWIYHSHGGRISSLRMKRHYGTSFANDTTIGCGVDFTKGKIFFTQQGSYLGAAFDDLIFNEPIAPALVIGSDTTVRVNLGSEPFVYDIRAYIDRDREATMQALESQRSPAADIELLEDVADYLVSAGYEKTLRSIPANLISPDTRRDKALETTGKRLAIMRLIKNGEITKAIAQLRQEWPTLIDNDEVLLMNLEIQELVEVAIDPNRLEEAIRLAKELEAKYGPSPHLTQIFVLFGVKDPDSRPELKALYSQETLDRLQEQVSQAILYDGMFTRGDSLAKKIHECHILLRESAAHGGAAALLPLDKLL